MSETSITERIPHRPPMLLIDEVLACEANRIVCGKTFRPEEFFLQGHYPGHPIVPGVILCECAAQSSAVLLAQHHVQHDPSLPEQVPVLARMNNVRFRKTIHPGDQIQISVTLNEVMSGAFFLSATIHCQGKMAASLDLACKLAPKAVGDSA